MSTNNENGGEPAYKVGRGRPPLHTRFVKGQSGNPSGRKKGSLNLKTIFEEVLTQEITMTEGGRPKKVQVGKALALSTVKAALSGQWRAGEALFDRIERLGFANAELEIGLPEEDRIILDRAQARWRESSLAADPSRVDEPAASDETDPDDEDEGDE